MNALAKGPRLNMDGGRQRAGVRPDQPPTRGERAYACERLAAELEPACL